MNFVIKNNNGTIFSCVVLFTYDEHSTQYFIDQETGINYKNDFEEIIALEIYKLYSAHHELIDAPTKEILFILDTSYRTAHFQCSEASCEKIVFGVNVLEFKKLDFDFIAWRKQHISTSQWYVLRR